MPTPSSEVIQTRQDANPTEPGPIVVQFNGWTCHVRIGRFGVDQSPAILLTDAFDGAPVANATVCMPDVILPAGHVLIKDCLDNDGMLSALEAAGVVRWTGAKVPTGNIELHVCELLLHIDA